MNREPIEGILEHYGVMGMKWGSRKTGAAGTRLTKKPYHVVYDMKRRSSDKAQFGKRGVNRINDRLLDGRTYEQARNREVRLSNVKSTIKAGAVLAAYVLASNPHVLDSAAGNVNQRTNSLGGRIADRAETKRGERYAADHFGLGPDSNINAKQNRDGTYKVTTM